MTAVWTPPDNSAIMVARGRVLEELRRQPKRLAAIKVHYRETPADFIRDWGMTFDPRLLEVGAVPHLPFVPWHRQIEYLEWLTHMWQNGQRGMVEKSRDCGVTWLSVGWAVCQWCFRDGFVAGFGSRKEELVDKTGDDKSIFEKLRYFIDALPPDFLPQGFVAKDHSANMRIIAPNTSSALIGEAGDNIGRGGRASVYLVDEAAFIERQEKVDAALSQNTNCQIDISTVNGSGNAFYIKRQRLDGSERLFVFDWRDDPRKNQAWYEKQKATLSSVIVAQEIDRDYNAAQEDAFIPGEWVAACIDAHITLGFEPSGIRAVGFDPADVGDAKAVVGRWGSIILLADQLTQGDITQAIPWAFDLADKMRADLFEYDGDGMGAPTMRLALQHHAAGRMLIQAFHGSGPVEDADKPADPADPKGKTRGDTYTNNRAVAWTNARDRIHRTWVAVERKRQGLLVNADPETLLSISSKCKERLALQSELSRPKRMRSPNGKIKVESKPEMRTRGIVSPNLADGAIICINAHRPVVARRNALPAIERGIHDRTVGY